MERSCVQGFKPSKFQCSPNFFQYGSSFPKFFMTAVESPEISAKSITKEIMTFFNESSSTKQKSSVSLKKRLESVDVDKYIDGMHVITILFQSARNRKLAKNILTLEKLYDKLAKWNNEWSERDISTFVYGIRSLECISGIEGKILRLGAQKISESKAVLSSRAIGNALYGLQVNHIST